MHAGSPSSPYQLVCWIQLEHVDVDVIVDHKLGLLFNLTNHQLKPQACMLFPVKTVDIKESIDLIPALSYMFHHNKEILQEVRRDQDIGSCEQWLSVKIGQDYLL